jgi:cytochrome c
VHSCSVAGRRDPPPGRLCALRSLCLAFLAIVATSAASAADVARGRELYESRCIGCHSIEANRVGPAHRGLFGRRAGGVKDFEYSPALAGATLLWDERTLDRWLANPEQLLPGQRMNYSVPESVDRADLIAYLRSQR